MTPDAHTYREQCYLKGPIGAFRKTYLGQAVLRACEKTRPHRATPLGEKPTFSFQSPEVASTAENAPCSAQPNARRDAGREHVQLRAARVVDEVRITASKRRSVNARSCAPSVVPERVRCMGMTAGGMWTKADRSEKRGARRWRARRVAPTEQRAMFE